MSAIPADALTNGPRAGTVYLLALLALSVAAALQVLTSMRSGWRLSGRPALGEPERVA